MYKHVADNHANCCITTSRGCLGYNCHLEINLFITPFNLATIDIEDVLNDPSPVAGPAVISANFPGTIEPICGCSKWN